MCVPLSVFQLRLPPLASEELALKGSPVPATSSGEEAPPPEILTSGQAQRSSAPPSGPPAGIDEGCRLANRPHPFPAAANARGRPGGCKKRGKGCPLGDWGSVQRPASHLPSWPPPKEERGGDRRLRSGGVPLPGGKQSRDLFFPGGGGGKKEVSLDLRARESPLDAETAPGGWRERSSALPAPPAHLLPSAPATSSVSGASLANSLSRTLFFLKSLFPGWGPPHPPPPRLPGSSGTRRRRPGPPSPSQFSSTCCALERAPSLSRSLALLCAKGGEGGAWPAKPGLCERRSSGEVDPRSAEPGQEAGQHSSEGRARSSQGPCQPAWPAAARSPRRLQRQVASGSAPQARRAGWLAGWLFPCLERGAPGADGEFRFVAGRRRLEAPPCGMRGRRDGLGGV